jgi:hypothetical protein
MKVAFEGGGCQPETRWLVPVESGQIRLEGAPALLGSP